MLLTHLKIVPVEGEIIEDGYIKITGKTIASLGAMDARPDVRDDTMMDCTGLTAYPGFVDAHSHLGMWEDGLGFEGDDGNEDTDPTTPQLQGLDAINPMDLCFADALEGGVTTVITGPGSANPVAGMLCAIKTAGRRIDDMVLKNPVGMKFALGENPKNCYHSKSQAPSTRMATASIIRELLNKAKTYLDDKLLAEDDEDRDKPEYDAKLEAMIPVLQRKIKAHFHAHRADDIFTAIRLSKEFDLDYVLVHCTEGHLIADLLAQENAPAINGPLIMTRSKPELRNATIRTPAVLSQNGVSTAICTDHPEVPIQYLLLSAALAVENGMEPQKALEAITLSAARICGIESRVGSLVPGKDADILLFDRDIFTLGAKPKTVLVNGCIVKKD